MMQGIVEVRRNTYRSKLANKKNTCIMAHTSCRQEYYRCHVHTLEKAVILRKLGHRITFSPSERIWHSRLGRVALLKERGYGRRN